MNDDSDIPPGETGFMCVDHRMVRCNIIPMGLISRSFAKPSVAAPPTGISAAQPVYLFITPPPAIN